MGCRSESGVWPVIGSTLAERRERGDAVPADRSRGEPVFDGALVTGGACLPARSRGSWMTRGVARAVPEAL